MSETTPHTSASLSRAILLAAQARCAMSEGASLEKALEAACRGADAAERAAAQSLVYGATRLHMLVDVVFSRLAKRPPEATVRFIALVALSLLVESPERSYTVCNEAVKAVKSVNVHAAGFVNACLRRFMREREALLAQARRREEVRFNAPTWWIAKMRAALGKNRADAMMALVQTRPPMTVRVNRRKTTVADWCAAARAAGVAVRELGAAPGALTSEAVEVLDPVPVTHLPGFAEGLVSVQDAGAQLAAHFLAPAAGERVLDACAAPGGKTAHLLELADCRVTALEVDPKRTARIHENLERLNLTARVVTADAGDIASQPRWYEGSPYDAVLLDAPCTASGIVRRHPDIVFSRRPSDVAALALQQKRLLEALWPLVKFGGRLLYVVCSVFKEEGVEQITSFLSRHPDAVLKAVRPQTETMITMTPMDADGIECPPTVPGIACVHDGFFYALLEKRSPA